jgi:hypothetical protein
MSELDLDGYEAALPTWDFAVKYKGTSYPTRPLTIGDLAVIEQMEKGKDAGLAQIKRVADFVSSIFTGKKPDVSKWPPDLLGKVVKAVGSYWSERTKKNAEMETAAAAVKDGGPSGS